MKKEESIYFSGSMLFISAQTQRLQDINLLKSLIQFHLDTDAKFWLEDHNAFLKDLLQKKQKEGSPVPSPASAGKTVVLRSAPENVPPKRLSIQQTSVESFDFAGPLSARADTQPLCADCAKLKHGRGRVKVLVQLFNKIANQKVTEKYRGATKSLRKRSAHGKSRVFRFSPEYFRRHNRNTSKKERRERGSQSQDCCLEHAGCNHQTYSQRRRCCRITSCNHSRDRLEETLPSPPPRGRSSAQTVQALKMKIEAGTPEMRRKMMSNKKGSTPMRNGVKSRAEISRSRAEISSSRDNLTSRDNMTSRDNIMLRDNIMTTSLDVLTSSEKMTSRTVSTVPDASSPNMSLRSEGSGRSLHNNGDEPSFTRNGAVQRPTNLLDSSRTPISRTSGKLFSFSNMPAEPESQIDFMKEELVSRLLKEKEELLKLRKKKESEREKIVELRREREIENANEVFDGTPEPRQRLFELDRRNYIIKETPIKSDSSSNPSQSPDSGGYSPRYKIRDTDLKSDAANRILFSENRQHSPITNSPHKSLETVEKRVTNIGRESSATKITPVSTTKSRGFHGRRPVVNLTKSIDNLDKTPSTPTRTRRVTVATAPLPSQVTPLSEQRPSNYEPQSMVTTPLRPRNNDQRSEKSFHKSDSRLDFMANGSQKSFETPTRDFRGITNASSTTGIDFAATSQNNSTSSLITKSSRSEEENRFRTLPPELNSPFNERAVDCPRTNERAVDCPIPDENFRKTFSLERGGPKLSPHGYDVVRTVVRTEGGERQEEDINPALLQPFRRRSRKGKEVSKDKCNTQ